MISVRNGRPGRARLAALGAYVPERVVTNAEMEERVETSDAWIVARTGIRERRFAATDQASSDLGVIAAERAMAVARIGADSIDMVIVATATPDHLFPSTAALLAHRIGARNAAAYDPVITSVEPDEVTGFLGFELGADGGGADQLLIAAGGSRMPVAMAERPSDGYIRMNGTEVFRFAAHIMVESTERLLAAAGLVIDDIDLVVAHQANSRILLVGFGGGLTWASTIVRYEPVGGEPS